MHVDASFKNPEGPPVDIRETLQATGVVRIASRMYPEYAQNFYKNVNRTNILYSMIYVIFNINISNCIKESIENFIYSTIDVTYIFSFLLE